MTHALIFTDLDGTLLDAETYSWQVSLPALQRLYTPDRRVIFCSAKTASEQRHIRHAVGHNDPYIVENGSAAIMTRVDKNDDAVPDNMIQVFGLPAPQVRRRLEVVRQVTGLALPAFSQMPTHQVVRLTGLDAAAAARAQQRDYSETVVLPRAADDATIAQFQAACAAQDLKAPSGGRFYTVTGANADKGAAVRYIINTYRQRLGDVRSIGIGDSPNDASMLAAVDSAYLVKRPDGTWRDVAVAGLIRLDGIGPAGFVQMVEREFGKA